MLYLVIFFVHTLYVLVVEFFIIYLEGVLGCIFEAISVDSHDQIEICIRNVKSTGRRYLEAATATSKV